MVSFSRALSLGRLFMSAARVGGVRAGVDSVADAGHGGDEPWFAESFAQCGDGDAHGVGEGVGVLVPGPFQELFGADDTAFGGDRTSSTANCFRVSAT